MGNLPFEKKKTKTKTKKQKHFRFQNLSNVKWVKYLNVGEEFIKITEENLNKYITTSKVQMCVLFCFQKRTQN